LVLGTLALGSGACFFDTWHVRLASSQPPFFSCLEEIILDILNKPLERE
jgi:hypothetical protein